jgi:hypothetical protein
MFRGALKSFAVSSCGTSRFFLSPVARLLASLRTRSPGVARQLPSFLAPQEKKAKEGAKVNTHVGVSSGEQGSVV